MKVLIYSRTLKEEDHQYVSQLLNELELRGISLCFFEDYHKEISKVFPQYASHDSVGFGSGPKKGDFDIVFSLGGDGTILHAVTLIKDAEIPICGINLGRLGFMAAIERTRITEAIDKIERGEYRIEARTMLSLTSPSDLFEEKSFALNDFTLHKRDTSSMMIIHTYVNDEFINSYWADGLVVSTPSGSTGYSLSCGGPIVFPESSNFIITPVAPHNLNVRPLVISSENKLSFKIEGRSKNYMCTLDSRSEIITAEEELVVQKSDFVANIVMLDDISFIETIRKKLNWGLDSRN